MNRLRFRAWLHEENEMADDVQNGFQFFEHSSRFTFGELLNDSAHFTVMQTTGLTDMNGKEIFEGDIVQSCWQHDGVTNYDYKLTGEVRWCPSVAAWSIYKEGEGQVLDYPMCSFEREELLEDGIEVIGNIHDNPELLSPPQA